MDNKEKWEEYNDSNISKDDIKEISDKCYIKLTFTYDNSNIVDAKDKWMYTSKQCIVTLKELGIGMIGKHLEYWKDNIDLINEIATALVKKGIVTKDNYPNVTKVMFKVSKDVYNGMYKLPREITYDWYRVLFGKKRIRFNVKESDRPVVAVKEMYGFVEDVYGYENEDEREWI